MERVIRQQLRVTKDMGLAVETAWGIYHSEITEKLPCKQKMSYKFSIATFFEKYPRELLFHKSMHSNLTVPSNEYSEEKEHGHMKNDEYRKFLEIHSEHFVQIYLKVLFPRIYRSSRKCIAIGFICSKIHFIRGNTKSFTRI